MRVPLYAGQPITNLALVHGDAAGFMASQLQPGMRAVSITISVDSGAGGFHSCPMTASMSSLPSSPMTRRRVCA